MENRFSRKQERILLALSGFWGLTYDHLLALGIDKHKQNLYTAMKPLRETKRKLVDSAYIIDPHTDSKFARKELLFYLTEKGARFVEQHLDKPYSKIKRPKKRFDLLTSDSHHRKQFIFCVIRLLLDSPADTITWHVFYFEKMRKRTATKIDLSRGYVESDMLFTIQKDKTYLFSLEYERKPDVKRICEKIHDYLKAMTIGQPAEFLTSKAILKEPLGMAVLYVFEKERTMLSVIERLSNDPVFNPFKDFFFFKSFEELMDEEVNFYKWWLTLDSKRKSIV